MNKNYKEKGKEIVEKLQNLQKLIPNSLLRRSQHNVPHIVVCENKGFSYAIAWMGKIRKFRIFYPYMTRTLKQVKQDLTTLEEVVKFIEEERKNKDSEFKSKVVFQQLYS